MGSAVAIMFVPSAPMRGGAQSWAARTWSCSSVRLPGVGLFTLVGSGCACEESASGASEGFGAGRFSQGRGRGGCRHCLPFHSTTLRLLYKREALWRSDTPTMAAISGAASAPQAFRGDASSRNEKSGNLASCLLVGGVLFRPLAIRHGVSPGHRGYDTPGGQKAPSAIRCIKNRPQLLQRYLVQNSQTIPLATAGSHLQTTRVRPGTGHVPSWHE